MLHVYLHTQQSSRHPDNYLDYRDPTRKPPMVPAHLVQRLKEEHTSAQAEVAALKARLALIEATSDESGIARLSSEEVALGGSEDLLPSAALCDLLELHPGKQHQPMAGRDLLALLLDAGHLQLAAARRGARSRWQAALKPAIALGAAVTDPWLEYNVHKQPTELAVRWDYDPATAAWASSETLIKMERTPFARGAMRECLRMKKMSQVSGSFFFSMNWAHCNNYVAKRYMHMQPLGLVRLAVTLPSP